MEVREVSAAMSRLGPVTPNMLDELFVDFVRKISSNGALNGNVDVTERLLSSFLPRERVSLIMEEIRGPAGRNMWEKLSNVQENVLANYLKNEYPQTVAVVLSKIDPDHAAKVLGILPEELRLEVISRMLKMEAIQKEVLEKVEQTLRVEFMSNLTNTSRRDSHEMMAEIFNNFDRQTEARFLAALEEENRDSAERIKTLMFTFDDLMKLDAGSCQTLLRNVEEGPSRHRAEGRLGIGARVLLLQHVVACREDDAGRHGGARTDPPARCRRGSVGHGRNGQGSRREGRADALQEQGATTRSSTERPEE